MSERQVVLTTRGLERIEQELRELQTVRRQEVADSIRQAKELGDVTENPEYESAKTEQAFLESRIAELKAMLTSCIVVDESDVPTDHVGIGSLVRVKDLDLDEDWDFVLVGSYEADPEVDRISNESPIGGAVLGKRVGDEVQVKTPGGQLRLRILSIERPTE